MRFSKYRSIQNSSKKYSLSEILQRNQQDIECVVQEKIHGANFSFWCDAKRVYPANRNRVLKAKDNFFSYQQVFEKYQDAARDLFEEVLELIPGARRLAIVGELIGGSYPHSDVEPVQDLKPVQKGVYYCPHLEFIAFDIMVIDGGGDSRYLTVDQANKLFEAHDFLYAKTLYRGPLARCIFYPNAFLSTIPERFGLPELVDNICEGVIIRSVETIFLDTRSHLILKSKNERWQEKSEKTLKELKKKLKKSKKKQQLSDTAQQLAQALVPLVCENRLRNVLSKWGDISPEALDALAKSLGEDAFAEFIEEHKEAFQQLPGRERHKIELLLQDESQRIVKQNAFAILDSDF